MLRACLRAVGLTPTTFAEFDAATASEHAVPGRDLPVAVVHGFTADSDLADAESDLILERNPGALISIERQGVDDHGDYHYGRGEKNIPALMAKIDRLFELAKARDFYTIGVGDGGNELGMANIRAAIVEKLPFGDVLVPSVGVSHLVPATVSNFGCYGIAACMAAILEDPAVLHTPEQEAALIAACVREGAVDGATGFVEPFVDSLSQDVCVGFVRLLHAIVGNGISPPKIYRVPEE